MSLLVFVYFTLTEFLTSFMIVASFITIGFEFVVLRPLSCLVISWMYFCKWKARKFVNISWKSRNFKNTIKAQPKSYITATLSRATKLKDEEMQINGNFNDSDNDMKLKNHRATWKNLHTSFDGLSNISDPHFNPSERLDPLFVQEDLDFMSQLGALNLAFLNQIYDAYGDKADEIIGKVGVLGPTSVQVQE